MEREKEGERGNRKREMIRNTSKREREKEGDGRGEDD